MGRQQGKKSFIPAGDQVNRLYLPRSYKSACVVTKGDCRLRSLRKKGKKTDLVTKKQESSPIPNTHIEVTR